MERKWFVGTGASLGFALAALMIVASTAITYLNLHWIAENEERVIHTQTVLRELEALLQDVLNGETGQRGYIITGEDSYLQPYNSALSTITEHLRSIEAETADNSLQVSQVNELKTAIDQRLASLHDGVVARRMGGVEAGRAFIQSGRGAAEMRAIREIIERMRSEEERLFTLRADQSKTSHRTAVSTTVATGLAGLAMVAIAYVMAAREVVRREKMNAELEQRVLDRTVALSEANSALAVSNRELEQFASVASHDLQEPLRKIEAFGDRLKTIGHASLDQQGKDYLDRVLASASRMRTLINDLLSFSRVATRAQPFTRVELNKIAAEVVSDLEGRLQDVKGSVKIGDLPALDADPTQIRQLFQNLIGNALKFHLPGVPPEVEVRSEIFTGSRDRSFCRLTVKDNGIGFEETYLDRIFEVFQRLHGRNEYEGTGIGLAICRRIVERHGGTITAQSAPEKGAMFIVTLPVSQSENEE